MEKRIEILFRIRKNDSNKKRLLCYIYKGVAKMIATV